MRYTLVTHGLRLKVTVETLVNTDGYGWLRLKSSSFNFGFFHH